MPDKYKRRVEQTNLLDIDPDKLTLEQLDKIAEHLIKRALGDNPVVVLLSLERKIEPLVRWQLTKLRTCFAVPTNKVH